MGELAPRSVTVLAAALRASPVADDGDDLPHATDRAVLEGGKAAGVEASDGLGDWTLLGELAFEPARGYHAVVGDSPRGPRVSVKGAPEVVLPRCATWRVAGGRDGHRPPRPTTTRRRGGAPCKPGVAGTRRGRAASVGAAPIWPTRG